MTAPTILTHNGETHTAQEWSEIIGVHKATLLARLRKGWPVEWVLSGTDYRGRPPNVFLSFDEKTLSLQEWAKITGLSIRTLHRRRKNGWTTEQILMTPFGEQPR